MKKLRAVEKITRTALLPGGPAERRSSRRRRRIEAAQGPKPADPARADRARSRRPRRTQRAA